MLQELAICSKPAFFERCTSTHKPRHSEHALIMQVRKLDGSLADVRLDRPAKQINSPVSSSLGIVSARL